MIESVSLIIIFILLNRFAANVIVEIPGLAFEPQIVSLDRRMTTRMAMKQVNIFMNGHNKLPFHKSIKDHFQIVGP